MVPSRVALALLILAVFACDDDPTGPRFGYVRLSVQATGSDLDDLFEITSDSIRLNLSSNATSTLQLLEGARSFELKGVAENCIVDGSSTASVNVVRKDTAQVIFKVGCAATGFTVQIATAGPDMPSSYQLIVPSLPAGPVPPNGQLTFTRIPPGRYDVRLSTGVSYCSVAGDSAVSVDVVNRQVTPVPFSVQCFFRPLTGVIAFVDAGSSTIIVMNADGSNQGDLHHGYWPSWSRDGTKIVYSATECDYYTYSCTGSLAVIDPITREITNLTAARTGTQPDWSPTEDVIVYADAQTLRPYLFSVETSLAAPINIAQNILIYHPSWSPDGTQIVASCFTPGSPSRLCIFKRDGSGFRYVETGDNSWVSDPSYSPDGTRIVFTKSGNTPSTIYTIKSEGTDLRQVVSGWAASWSPDGSEIIYTAQTGLFIIDAGGTSRRVTNGNHYGAVWRP